MLMRPSQVFWALVATLPIWVLLAFSIPLYVWACLFLMALGVSVIIRNAFEAGRTRHVDAGIAPPNVGKWRQEGLPVLKLLKLIRWDWIAFAGLLGIVVGVLRTAYVGEATFWQVVLGVAAAFVAGLHLASAAWWPLAKSWEKTAQIWRQSALLWRQCALREDEQQQEAP